MRMLINGAMAMLLFGIAGASLADQKQVATNGPTPQEIIHTLVRQAPDLEAERSLRGEDPSDTATLFVTEMLHELGLHAPQTEDTYRFSAACDPASEGWTCRVVLGIKWSGAESVIIAEFGLEENTADTDCAPYNFDTSPLFSPCKWQVQGDLIKVDILG